MNFNGYNGNLSLLSNVPMRSLPLNVLPQIRMSIPVRRRPPVTLQNLGLGQQNKTRVVLPHPSEDRGTVQKVQIVKEISIIDLTQDDEKEVQKKKKTGKKRKRTKQQETPRKQQPPKKKQKKPKPPKMMSVRNQIICLLDRKGKLTAKAVADILFPASTQKRTDKFTTYVSSILSKEARFGFIKRESVSNKFYYFLPEKCDEKDKLFKQIEDQNAIEDELMEFKEKFANSGLEFQRMKNGYEKKLTRATEDNSCLKGRLSAVEDKFKRTKVLLDETLSEGGIFVPRGDFSKLYDGYLDMGLTMTVSDETIDPEKFSILRQFKNKD